MSQADELSLESTNQKPMDAGIVPPTVHLVSLLGFVLDQLKQLIEPMSVLEPECEHRLQAVLAEIKPMDMHGSPSKQTKVISCIPMAPISWCFCVSQSKSSVSGGFLPLCYTGSQITQSVILVLKAILQKTHFEPGEVLLFPQPQSKEQLEQCMGEKSNVAASLSLDTANKVTLSSGLTVSTWIKLVSNQCSTWKHIFSIGNKDHLETVAEIRPKTGVVRIRVLNRQLCVFEKLFASIVRLGGAWVNLMIGLRYSNGEIRATVMVGNHNVVFNKAVQLKLALEEVPLTVSFGSRTDSDLSTSTLYLMSTLFAFKGVLGPNYGLLLRSIGSACFSLTDCRVSQIYCSFLNCLAKPTVCSNHFEAHQVCNEQPKYLTKLQRSVLFTLRPSSAHCFALNILQKGLDANSLTEMSDSALCLTMSKDLPVHWHTTIAQYRTDTIDKSLRTLGGVKIFIFLYALSVDRDFSNTTQLHCLSLLFSCLKRDPSYHQEFSQQGGNAILVRILSCRTAHMDLAICQEILGFIFSKLELNQEGELSASPRSTVVEPCLLKALLGSAELWGRKVSVLEKNCRDPIGYVPKQANVSDPLPKPSPQSKPSSEETSNKCRIAEVLNTLVGEIVGMPYRVTEVTQLWNFILLSHPAYDTYLDYSIESHNGWIKAEALDPGEEPQLDGKHSELSDFLQEMLQKHGKEKISRLWVQSNNSAIAVRQQLAGEVTRSKEDRQDFSGPSRFTRMNSVDNRCLLKPDFSSDATDTRHRFPSDIPIQEHWLVQVRAKFLSMMSDIVVNCSDSLMAVVELDVLYWQTALVLLSNQKYSKIRTLTFMLLKNFFLRCTPTHRLSFVNKHGFFLLSNELKKSSVNNQIADALFSMTCGEHVVLRDESVGDVSLFWSVCSTLQKMFIAENAPRRSMLEIGLVDTMVNVLRKLCFSTTGPPVDSPVFSLLDCWVSFAQSIIIFLVPYRDANNYSVCEDFLWLCIIAVWQHEQQEVANNETALGLHSASLASKWQWDRLGTAAEDTAPQSTRSQPDLQNIRHSKAAVKGMRKALCQLIYCWIDCIQSTLSDQMRPTALYAAANELYSSTEEADFEMVMPEATRWSPAKALMASQTREPRKTELVSPTGKTNQGICTFGRNS
uniref:Uncharacterized protein n=1 Tax=Ditylenchus dipsaci TaxID=166011 RepID=A0A915DQP9_9BILA